MGQTLTAQALSALGQVSKQPNMVLLIDGVDTVFTASIIGSNVRIGDDGLVIGDPDVLSGGFIIGGLKNLPGQDNCMTPEGTSTSIKQALDLDRGMGSSISNLSIALMDDGSITELITPGLVVDDILQRQAIVYIGLDGTSYPEDYFVIFRGVITEYQTDAGKIIFQINAPDDKKRTNIFKKTQAKLAVGLDAASLVAAVDTVEGFLVRCQGPFHDYDPAFASYVRIDDEIIKYTGTAEARTATVTITLASPGVVTLVAHGLVAGTPIYLSTTGNLPTGLTVETWYYLVGTIDADHFRIAATAGGAAINTSVSQTGIHTAHIPAIFTGVTRAGLTSVAATHAVDADVAAYYTLSGNGVELALKLLASGNVSDEQSQPFVIDIPFTSINVGGPERYDNALFFKGISVSDRYGLVAGDCLHESGGSSYIENRVRNKVIVEIIKGETGDFVIIDDVSFIDDVSTTTPDNVLTCAFSSQYATLPDGCQFRPDEIDVEGHENLNRLFLSQVEYLFYIKEGIESAREFLELQVYAPMSAYSIPRKARASMGYHIGPLPGTFTQVFDETNLKNPKTIKAKRSNNKNFWNEILYQYDQDPLEDKYNSGAVFISEDSKNRMPNSANRTLIIEASGLRTDNLGGAIASAQAARRLKRYEYGAEIFTFESTMVAGFAVEIGDIVILDGRNLDLPDSKTGLKGLAPRLLEIQNKTHQLKTGSIQFEALDTKFNGAARYCLMSPASYIKDGTSTTEFIIEESFGGRFGASEYRKWNPLKLCSVVIRNADFSVSAETVIQTATSNKITVSPALPFTPSPGMIMEMTHYDVAEETDQQHLLYGYMRDSDFADDTPQYVML